jgi:hypothetical protein
MTPGCDIDQEKVLIWSFVALFPDGDVAREVTQPEISGWGLAPDANGRFAPSTKQLKQLRKDLENLVRNRYPRYQWLPIPLGANRAHVADFAQVTSIPVDEARTLGRVCSLNSSWREQVQARYVAYMGRVGTEDLPGEEMERHVDRLVKACGI